MALSCVLMWLSGQWPVHLPGILLPVTLQSMVAILLPLVMDKRSAQGGILMFLILGATGLPVFAGASGGIEHFLGNSGGYLIGFYFCALLAGWLKTWCSVQPFLRGSLVFLTLHTVLTAIGLGWIAATSASEIAFSTHISPFLPGVVVKSAFGALIFEATIRIQPPRSK